MNTEKLSNDNKTEALNKHVVMQELPESDDYNGITLTCSFDGNVLIRILNALRKHDHELYVELSSRVIDFGTQKLGSSSVGDGAVGKNG